MTPRPYLSWTQLDLIEHSEQRYIRVYLEGENIPINRGMAFGKKMADDLEKEDLTGDPVLDLVIAQVPSLSKKEHTIEAELGGVPLLGRLDDFNEENKKEFAEVKTGLHPWTQTMVDKHGQVDFYYTLIYAAYGIKPEDVKGKLIYIPTRYNRQGRVEVTGEVVQFEAKRKFADILKMNARQKKAWKKIKELSINQLT